MNERPLWGFFSRINADRNGSVIYSTPDGGEVQITAVSPDPGYQDAKWVDMVPCGPVIKYLRTVPGAPPNFRKVD